MSDERRIVEEVGVLTLSTDDNGKWFVTSPKDGEPHEFEDEEFRFEDDARGAFYTILVG